MSFILFQDINSLRIAWPTRGQVVRPAKGAKIYQASGTRNCKLKFSESFIKST